MKTIITLICCLFAFTNYAQLSDAQLTRFRYQVDSASSLLHQSLLAKGQSVFATIFTVDTFKVERMLKLKLKSDTSKMEQIASINDAEIQYDFLITKYYKILLNMYNEKDQKKITADQKTWTKYRDYQIAITEKNYDEVKGNEKGKTIAKAKYHLELSKLRVVDLYKQILASPFFENQ
jgi:hypothetical protein